MSSWADLADEVDGESQVYYREFSSKPESSYQKDSCCSLVHDIDRGHALVHSNPLSSLLKSINSIQKYNANSSFECSVNLLANSSSVAVLATLVSKIQLVYKKIFADNYLRYRHELFFHLVLSYLFLDQSKSDIKFCDVLPIDSDRTPDCIYKLSETRILIIEVTVTTDYEKALFQKGSIDSGYQPKYSEEISDLILKGYEVLYKVLIWDMIRPDSSEYLNELAEISSLIGLTQNGFPIQKFETHRKEVMQIHSMVSKNFSGEMSLVLSSKNKILFQEHDVNNISHLLTRSDAEHTRTYSRLTVSPDIHSRFIKTYDRLTFYLKRHIGSKSIVLVYNTLNSKFYFEKESRLGTSYDKWFEMLKNKDYTGIFLYTYIRTGGQLKESYRYDNGVNYFILQDKTESRFPKHRNLINFFYRHRKTSYNSWAEAEVNFDSLPSFTSAFLDEDYEDKILDKIFELDSSTDWGSTPDIGSKTLSSCLVDDEMKSESLYLYNKRLINDNDFNLEQIPPKVYGFKNSFIFPVADGQNLMFTDFREKPTGFLNAIIDRIKNSPYTVQILTKALDKNFSFGSLVDSRLLSQDYVDKMSKRSSASSDYYQRLKEVTINHGLTKMMKYSEAKRLDPSLAGLYDEMIKQDKSFKKYISDKNLPNHKLPLVKVSTKPGTLMGDNFRMEMQHFKNPENTSYIKGFGNGLSDFDSECKSANTKYENFIDFLLSPSMNRIADKIMDNYVAPDVAFLELIKKEHVKRKENVLDMLSGTNLYNATAFVSRLCHSLMYYSQCSFSSEYTAVDTLGHSNVLLIVKGGKKIFKTKASKLFRLIFPVNKAVIPFITDNKTSSYRVQVVNGFNYCFTPWINMHEAHVSDGIAFHHKICGFLLMNLSKLQSIRTRTLLFNVALAFHGRRSTEELLHGVRYFISNNLGTRSNLVDLMPSFSGFNRDIFQFLVRANLSTKYSSFNQYLKTWQGKEQKPVPHLFCNSMIHDVEDLAFLIYSTYLMTKAPITQVSEQVKNLKSILKIHQEVNELDKEKLNINLEGQSLIVYAEKLFKNDMNVDLKFCSTLGKFCGDYLLSKSSESSLLGSWEHLTSKGWQTLANTKGLRGDSVKGKFFGEKGYYVTLEKITQNENFTKCIDIINSDMDEHLKRKLISKLNETYKSQIKDSPGELKFHAVDKRQRGGSREIYVMDLNTKLHQQPIEGFLKRLCKLMPNEVISIPSNKRSQFVHSKVFEHRKLDEGASIESFVTLDCRKWAPKSSLEKYIVFIASMSHALPEEFTKHFLRFFNSMLKKKFVTRKAIYDVFVKSIGNESLSGYFKIIDDRAEMNMNYSFMMGIFNYLSSLMHATNQLYASHLISTSAKIFFNETIDIIMLCHSDDSAGKIIARSEEMLTRSLFLYELFLKSCNHLLSIKKCVVSLVYFEFLSIFYFKNKLMPLLPKFLSGISFRPTDKGYCSDILTSLNKSNELILNGASFDSAYLSIKIQSHLIWKFYFNKDPSPSDYFRPVQLLGMPDPHPLSSMIVGGDSEILRLFLTGGKENLNVFYRILTYLSTNFDSEDSMIPTLIVNNPVHVTKPLLKNLITKLKSSLPEFSESWSISNVNFRNTQIEAMQISLKCQDRTFVSAMQDEELTRRISRSYNYRSSNCINTKLGSFSYKSLIKLIDEFLLCMQSDSIEPDFILNFLGFDLSKRVLSDLRKEVDQGCNNVIKMLNIMHGEYIHFLKYMDRLGISEVKTETRRNTCKPVHLYLQKTTQPLIKIPDVAALVSYIKEPSYRGLLSDLTNMPTLMNIINRYLENLNLSIEDMSPTVLYKILMKLNSNMSKEFYFYSNMPSDCRNIVNYHDLCTFLAHNTFPEKQILGISLYFSDSIKHTSAEFIASLMTREYKSCTSFISMCYNILRSEKENFYYFKNLLVGSEFFNGEKLELSVEEMIIKIKTIWKSNSNAYNFIMPYLTILENICLGTYSFDHTGSVIGNIEFLKNSFYYCYLKKQKLISNKWYGDAIIYIRAKELQVIVEFNTYQIKSFKFQSEKGPLPGLCMDYINYVLKENDIKTINESLQPNLDKDGSELIIGIDKMGVYQIAKSSLLEFVMPESKLDFTVDTQSKHLLSNSFRLEDEMSVTINVGEELSGRSNLKLNFLKLDISLLQEMTKTIFDKNDENHPNRLIMNRLSGPLMEQFNYYIFRNMGLDLYVDFDEVLKDFTNTRVYKMMHHLEAKDLLPVIEEKRPKYTGESGGLLHVLLKSKQTGFPIDIINESILTSHLLNLKSNNPESYLSAIYDNITPMYENLYSSDMKLEIAKDLSVIYKSLLGGSDQSDKMQLLLRKWGLAGIEGSLMSYTQRKSERFFDYFYLDGCAKSLRSSFSRCLPNLIKAILEVFSKNKSDARLVLENMQLTPRLFKYDDLSELLNGSILCISYTIGSRGYFPHLSYPIGMMPLFKCLETILCDETLCVCFQQLVEDDDILRILPVNEGHIKDWFNVLTCLINSYVVCNKFKHSPRLNVGDVSNRLVRENYITLYGDSRLTSKMMRYGGTISPQLMSDLTHKIVVKNEGVYYHFKPRLVGLSYNYFYDCEGLNACAPLNEDVLDSDEYMDLKVELGTNDQDKDYIKTLVSQILSDNPNPYKSDTKIRKERIDANVSIMIAFGCSGIPHFYRHVRQAGENILVISDFAMDMPFSGCHTGHYRPGQGWNFPIFHNSNVVVNLICNFEVEEALKSAYILEKLDCDFDERIYEVNLTFGMKMSTREYSKSSSEKMSEIDVKTKEALNLQLKDINLNFEKDDLESEQKRKNIEINEIFEKLISKGISKDLAKSVSAYIKISENEPSTIEKILKKLSNDLDEAGGMANLLMEYSKDVLTSGLKDKEAIEDALQVAQVMREGSERNRGKRNTALKDQTIRAEINSLSVGLSDRIVSGNLVIDEDTREELLDNIDMGKRLLSDLPEDYNKKSMLDFILLIINDAHIITDEMQPEDDSLWKNIRRKISKVNSRRRTIRKNRLSVDPGNLNINYKLSGV